MNFVHSHLPIGHPNRPGKKLEGLRAIVFHYTANDAPGATDTANVRYIGRAYKMIGEKPYEFDGKTPFRYGSAHVFADHDSVTEAIPPNEVCWGCVDRNLPYDEVYKGQQPVALNVFGNRQNYFTVNVEICNNDVLPGLDDWESACRNAAAWTALFIRKQGLIIDLDASLSPQVSRPEPGSILLLRHYDLTGKICPKPFVEDIDAWMGFLESMDKGGNPE